MITIEVKLNGRVVHRSRHRTSTGMVADAVDLGKRRGWVGAKVFQDGVEKATVPPPPRRIR